MVTGLEEWGRACGKPLRLGNNCQVYQDISLAGNPLEGLICTCSDSWCNNVDRAARMVDNLQTTTARPSDGVLCHVCQGTDGGEWTGECSSDTG